MSGDFYCAPKSIHYDTLLRVLQTLENVVRNRVSTCVVKLIRFGDCALIPVPIELHDLTGHNLLFPIKTTFSRKSYILYQKTGTLQQRAVLVLLYRVLLILPAFSDILKIERGEAHASLHD